MRGSLVPAGFAERRDMRQDDDVPETRQGFRQHASEVSRRLVAEGVQLNEPLSGVLVESVELSDQREVIEHDVRALVVAQTSVTPAVMADQAGGLGELDDPGVGHPAEIRYVTARLADHSPHASDRPAVEVVVSENEVHRSQFREGP